MWKKHIQVVRMRPPGMSSAGAVQRYTRSALDRDDIIIIVYNNNYYFSFFSLSRKNSWLIWEGLRVEAATPPH